MLKMTNPTFKGGLNMLRKLLALILALLLCVPAVFAEDDPFASLNIPPTEAIIHESEFLHIESVFYPEQNVTRSVAKLTGNPAFADGTPVTAQDLLFSLYVYLDPAYPFSIKQDIVGLRSYTLQISEQRLTNAAKAMAAIRKAGEDHVWRETDAWTQAQQETYWTLQRDYLAACKAEFAVCAQSIVDYCSPMLAMDSKGAFTLSADEIASDEGLSVAYAMLQWGYADSSDTMLIARHSGRVWNLPETKPTLQDFADELSLAYGGDLRACWAIETTGSYTPDLPDVEAGFRSAYLGNEKDRVLSVSGVRTTEDGAIEILFHGINAHGAASLLSKPALSLTACGNAELWLPEEGLYGHPFGEIPDLNTFEGPVLIEYSDEIIF